MSKLNKITTNMIKLKVYPNDCLIPLDSPVINDNGTIQNLITNGMESIAVITSKKGSVRSNHYHLENSHYLYIVSGLVEYFERNLDGSDFKQIIVKAGEMFFTPPRKVHKVVALEETVMISLAPKSNEHLSHEEDIVRIEF